MFIFSHRLALPYLLIVVVLLMPSTSFAQNSRQQLPGAMERFSAAERELDGRDDYWMAREKLVQEALAVAETDIKSDYAEKLLIWIVTSGRTSPAAARAAEHLATHHLTSDLSVRKLISFAQSPRAWTPALFQAYSAIERPRDQRSIVEFSSALHQKGLLELTDEIKLADKEKLPQYYTTLGKELTHQLLQSDVDELESNAIEVFTKLSTEHGGTVIGGVTIKELADGAIYSIRHLRLGRRAIGLKGIALDGKTIDLSDFEGRVILVDFWATWCGPCVGAVPDHKELVLALKGAPFTLIGVSVDEDKDVLRKFVASHGISWPIIADDDASIQKKWMALSLPRYYVLDKTHVVRYRGSDFQTAATTSKSLLDYYGAVMSLFRILDKNNDQRIKENELPNTLPDHIKSLLFTADVNADGFLSMDELSRFVKDNPSSFTSTPVKMKPTNVHD